VKRIAALDDYLDLWRLSGDWGRIAPPVELVTFHDHLADEDAVAERLRDFEIVLAWREKTPLPASLIENLPKLEFIATMGHVNNSIDVAAARRCGVMVSGTRPDLFPVAELAFGLILALARNIVLEDKRTRVGGSWQSTIGLELRGRTIGILGLGHIGGAAARIAQGFGMKVIAWSRALTPERAAPFGAECVSKDELFRRSDFVVIALAGGKGTAGLVGAREIGLMKRDAYLVNVSRASIVDQAAMIIALKEGRIAGAGLDVFDIEPLPVDHPLVALDNVVIHPHMGNAVRFTQAQHAAQIIENIQAWLDGAPIRLLDDTGRTSIG
jgi:phosphoglycerate dehydrogenase-like enzyme